MPIDIYEQGAVIRHDTTIEELSQRAELACIDQRGVNWWIGDYALAAERLFGELAPQVWPEWMSPDHIARCKAVSAAYPLEDRNIHATWTTHYHYTKMLDRVKLVQAAVDAGLTSDEARKATSLPAEEESPAESPKEAAMPAEPAKPSPPAAKPGWLLAVDANYYVRSRYEREGLECISSFVKWFDKTLAALRGLGLSDLVFCFDSPVNFRKELTVGWDSPYKNRSTKSEELVEVLNDLPVVLERRGGLVVRIHGFEADDLMASYAHQFPGRVTLLVKDKDLRQCLVDKRVNILENVRWEMNEHNKLMPVYDWANYSDHMEGCKYGSSTVSGITPDLWPHFQAIAGDPVDDISGVVGIGPTYAQALVTAHGTVQEVLQAAHAKQVKLSEKLLAKLLAWEPFAETTVKLTTMRKDLELPWNTRIAWKDEGDKR